MLKVYVSDYDYPDLSVERGVLEPAGIEVVGLQCKTGDGLAEMAPGAGAILQQYAKIPRSTIEKLAAGGCKAICRYGIGLDIVDVEAAYEHGLLVTNVPDYCLEEVADHTIALAFMLIRRIPMYDRATHSGKWHWQEAGGPIHRFRNMTWGFIGFGRIAQNMVPKLRMFGFTLQAYDPFLSESLMGAHAVKKSSLEDVSATSDVVSVMCPYTAETHGLVNEELLRRMRKHAVLLNTTRGKIVDNKALYRALKEGWIASAGLDDLEEEPAKLDRWRPQDNPLFTLSNCVVTPHVAYVSEEALNECRRVAAENALAVLSGRTPPNLVRPQRIIQQ